MKSPLLFVRHSEPPSNGVEAQRAKLLTVRSVVETLILGVIAFAFCSHLVGRIFFPPRSVPVINPNQYEATLNLLAFYEAEETFHEKHGSYTDDWSALSFTPSIASRYYKLSWEASPESFAMTAVGNIDEDPALDVWYVTEKSWSPVWVQNDVTDNH